MRHAAHELSFGAGELTLVRARVGAWAGEHALGAQATEELVLAVNELATNSIRHGGGEGTLRCWRERDTLICEVRDSGWITDPLAGSVRPAPDARGGRGLWLAKQLCDLVQIHSTPSGSAVRVHKRLTGAG